MLNEGFKVDLLRRERDKKRKEARAERKAAWKTRRGQAFKSGILTGISMYATDTTRDFEDRVKDKMNMRTLDKIDRRRAKQRAKRRYDMEEAVTSATYGEKAKSWVTKKSPKFRAAVQKHGPKLQMKADKWGGRAAMVGHHVSKFTKENPRTATAIKWGGGIAAGVVAGTVTNLATHYATHKARMKDPNYEYETRKRYGRVREDFQAIREDLHKMHHTKQAASNVNHKMAAHVAVTRGMAQDKVAAAGKALMRSRNNKAYQVNSRTKTNTRTESVSERVQLRTEAFQALAIPVVAGARAVASQAVKAVGKAVVKKATTTTAKSAAKSAGKFAASEIGSRAASKIMTRKENVDENLLNRFTNSSYKKQAKETARIQKKVGDPKNYLRLKKKGVVEGNDPPYPPLSQKTIQAVKKRREKLIADKPKVAKGYYGSPAHQKAMQKLTGKKPSTTHRPIRRKMSEGYASMVTGALKSGTAKGFYKAAGTGAAQQVGAGVGARMGNRIAQGTNRSRMKQAKFQRKLDRKAGGRFREGIEEMGPTKVAGLVKDFHLKPVALSGKVGADILTKPIQLGTGRKMKYGKWYEPAKLVKEGMGKVARSKGGKRMLKAAGSLMTNAMGGGSLSGSMGGQIRHLMKEDVSPKARSQFEIDPIKQRKEYLHMMRNEYIQRKGKISRKARGMAKPNEASRHVQEGRAGEAAKKGYAWLTKGSDTEQFKRLGKVVGGTAVAAGAARYAWKRRKTNRKYQNKMARYHEKRYNKHASHLEYLDAVQSAKQQRKQSLRNV